MCIKVLSEISIKLMSSFLNYNAENCIKVELPVSISSDGYFKIENKCNLIKLINDGIDIEELDFETISSSYGINKFEDNLIQAIIGAKFSEEALNTINLINSIDNLNCLNKVCIAMTVPLRYEVIGTKCYLEIPADVDAFFKKGILTEVKKIS